MITSKWLNGKIENTIVKNPNVKSMDIQNKIVRKWNVEVSSTRVRREKALKVDHIYFCWNAHASQASQTAQTTTHASQTSQPNAIWRPPNPTQGLDYHIGRTCVETMNYALCIFFFETAPFFVIYVATLTC